MYNKYIKRKHGKKHMIMGVLLKLMMPELQPPLIFMAYQYVCSYILKKTRL